MSGFLTKLEYKCVWYGAEYVKADRWFASSKLCSHCGWKNDDLALSDREWWCGGCGVLNDRDANAAMNLANWPGLSFPVSGRGDRVRPAMPAVVSEASVDLALNSGLHQTWSIRFHHIQNSGGPERCITASIYSNSGSTALSINAPPVMFCRHSGHSEQHWRLALSSCATSTSNRDPGVVA